MKFYIETIGCQQNEYDASKLANFLKSAGFFEVGDDEADAIFILACAVRQTAVDRIYGRAKNWLNAGKQVYITSCLTDEDKKKLEKKGVKYFAGLGNLSKILSIQNTKYDIQNTNYVPIMSGCNNFCSYCIVPYTRGREASRPVDEVLTEVEEVIKSGQKEIMLLGQNVNSYKIQNSKFKTQKFSSKFKTDFAKLLERVNNLPGNFEISFISNHPKDMSDDVIKAIAILSKVKKEIHLPLQSGSDKVLGDMNRPYTAGQYLELVEKIKAKIPNVKITTDIIVGFPTETEEDFEKTVEVCKKVEYSLAYINKFSPRKGTAAYKLGDPIPWAEKQRRWRILDDLINKKSLLSEG